MRRALRSAGTRYLRALGLTLLGHRHGRYQSRRTGRYRPNGAPVFTRAEWAVLSSKPDVWDVARAVAGDFGLELFEVDGAAYLAIDIDAAHAIAERGQIETGPFACRLETLAEYRARVASVSLPIVAKAKRRFPKVEWLVLSSPHGVWMLCRLALQLDMAELEALGAHVVKRIGSKSVESFPRAGRTGRLPLSGGSSRVLRADLGWYKNRTREADQDDLCALREATLADFGVTLASSSPRIPGDPWRR
jgi:hypothetical protein